MTRFVSLLPGHIRMLLPVPLSFLFWLIFLTCLDFEIDSSEVWRSWQCCREGACRKRNGQVRVLLHLQLRVGCWRPASKCLQGRCMSFATADSTYIVRYNSPAVKFRISECSPSTLWIALAYQRRRIRHEPTAPYISWDLAYESIVVVRATHRTLKRSTLRHSQLSTHMFHDANFLDYSWHLIVMCNATWWKEWSSYFY